jgi:hypothetical protein
MEKGSIMILSVRLQLDSIRLSKKFFGAEKVMSILPPTVQSTWLDNR